MILVVVALGIAAVLSLNALFSALEHRPRAETEIRTASAVFAVAATIIIWSHL